MIADVARRQHVRSSVLCSPLGCGSYADHVRVVKKMQEYIHLIEGEVTYGS